MLNGRTLDMSFVELSMDINLFEWMLDVRVVFEMLEEIAITRSS